MQIADQTLNDCHWGLEAADRGVSINRLRHEPTFAQAAQITQPRELMTHAWQP